MTAMYPAKAMTAEARGYTQLNVIKSNIVEK